MKHRCKSIVFLLFYSAIFNACANKETQLHGHETIWLRVPVLQDSGEYEFEDVEVPSPRNLETLDNDLVIFGKGRGSTCAKGQAVGKKPKYVFSEIADNTYFANSDVESLNASKIYVEINKLKKIIDALPADLNKEFDGFFPLRVSLLGELDFYSDNAAYSFWCNSLEFYTTKGLNFSTALDSSSVSHELFHAISYYLSIRYGGASSGFNLDFARDIPSKNSISFTELLDWATVIRSDQHDLRGQEEGMADLWSFSMTGNSDVLYHLNPKVDGQRKIDVKSAKLDLVKFSKVSESIYQYGTLMADYFLVKFNRIHRSGERFPIDKEALRIDLLRFLLKKVKPYYFENNLNSNWFGSNTKINDYFKEQYPKKEESEVKTTQEELSKREIDTNTIDRAKKTRVYTDPAVVSKYGDPGLPEILKEESFKGDF